MVMQRFVVRRIGGYDSIAQVMLDMELFQTFLTDGTLDPKTLTLMGLKKGRGYTLEPLDDPRVMALRSVRNAYLALTEKPMHHMSTSMQRMDTLIDVVGTLFSDIEFIHVENAQDLDNIISPPTDFEHKLIKITILGELLKEIIATGAADEEGKAEEAEPELPSYLTSGDPNAPTN